MARRIFISFQHRDRMRAKGFNLLRWNKNVKLNFVGRHLLDPVQSTNENYIGSRVKQQLRGTSVTVVLIGKTTHKSEWVKWEIEQSVAKDKPNGVLGILLPGAAPPPIDSPVGNALHQSGAEVISWDPHAFDAAIDRAFLAAGRDMTPQNPSSGEPSCGR